VADAGVRPLLQPYDTTATNARATAVPRDNPTIRALYRRSAAHLFPAPEIRRPGTGPPTAYLDGLAEVTDIEAGLLDRARSGDRTAFDALVGPLIEPGYRLAFGMLHDREAAEDAVQEATFRAWMRLENVRPGWSMRPWFFAIVANQCRSLRRTRWWSVVKLAAPWMSIAAPEDQVVRGADLRRALRALPTDRLEVLVLHYYMDLSLEEVAAVVGVPLGTVKSRMHRALEQLRPQLDLVNEVFG